MDQTTIPTSPTPQAPMTPIPVASGMGLAVKIFIVVLAVIVIGGGGFFAYQKFSGTSTSPSVSPVVSQSTVPLETRHIKIDEFGFEFDIYNPWKGSKVSNVDRQTPVLINLYPEQSKSPEGKFIGPYVLVYVWYLDEQTYTRIQSGVSLGEISKEDLVSTGNVSTLRVVSESPLSVAGLPAYTITYTGQLAGHTEISKIKGMVINNGRVNYIINYIAAEESFDTNLAEAMIVFNTFSVDRSVVIPTPITSQY